MLSAGLPFLALFGARLHAGGPTAHAGIAGALGHAGIVYSIAFSPDSKLAVSGGDDDSVRVWNLARGEAKSCLTGHTGAVTAVAVAGDTIVSASEDRTVRVWSLSTGAQRLVLRGHTDHVNAVAISRDGTRIVSAGSDGACIFWSSATGEALRSFRQPCPVRSVAFRPQSETADREVLLALENGKAVAIDGDSGKTRLELDAPGSRLRSAGYSSDGTSIATGSEDGTLRLWDAADGRLQRLYSAGAAVRSLQFSPKGGLLGIATAQGAALNLAEAERGRVLSESSSVEGIAFSPDGSWVATGGASGIRIYGAASGVPERAMSRETGAVASVSFADNDASLLIGVAGTRAVRRWKLRENQPGDSLTWDAEPLACMAASKSGDQVLVSGEGLSPRLWSGPGEDRPKLLSTHYGKILAAAFSPDGRYAVTGSLDRSARVWDTRTGEMVRALYGHRGWVSAVAFSPSGKRVATAGSDGTLRLWDLPSGQLSLELDGAGAVGALAFDRRGERVVTTSWDAATIWDLAKRAVVTRLYGHSRNITAALFTGDGLRVITAGRDHTIRIWDAASGQELKRLQGHLSGVTALALSSDGKTLASAGLDGTVRLWQTDSGREISVIVPLTDGSWMHESLG